MIEPTYEQMQPWIEADRKVDEVYEAIFRNACLEYLSHRLKINDIPAYGHDMEFRKWGNKSFELFEAMVESSKPLL
jgi:hypothetical protein